MTNPIVYKFNPLHSTSPFLSIITRCYKKTKCLANNIMSIEKQIDKDYEQIFIVDQEGLGLAWADKALDIYKDINKGKYILVLDDDDELVSKAFVSIIKDIANRYNPNIIIFRGYFTELDATLPPIDPRWGKYPVRSLIGSFNYVTTKELYNKYIYLCSSGITGDFDFFETLFNKTPKDKVYWLKKTLVKTQQKSYGKDIDIK